jgi:hypothetical protein
MKPFTVTREQARDLRQVAAHVKREGGIPHAEVVRRMAERMERDLRSKIKRYRHPDREAELEIFELAAYCHADGIDISEPLEEMLTKIVEGSSRAA